MWSCFNMSDYRKYILTKLLDKYEKSKVFRGENLVNRKIDFKFNLDTLKDYYHPTNVELKLEINEVCKNLEKEGLIFIHWQKYEEGNIIERIQLNIDNVDIIYKELKRTRKIELERQMINFLKQYENHPTWISEFVRYLINRLEKGESIDKYFSLNDQKLAQDIFIALEAILKQEIEIPKRLFSIKLFNHSKYFETIEHKIISIMKEFGPYGLDANYLAEENIIDNPGYVYLKGTGIFKCGEQFLDLSKLTGDVGLSTNLLKNIEIIKLDVSRIITIENLTSFHTYTPQNELVIYLGGYHNKLRRSFLKMLHEFNPHLIFYHWGDLDLGGFRILHHLRSQTGVPFKPLYMDLNTLKYYEDYAMPINKEYEKQLIELLGKEEYQEFRDVIQYMVDKKIRLEQEIVGFDK